VLGAAKGCLISADGEIENIDKREAVKIFSSRPVLVCHSRAMARRLNCTPSQSFDLLELFAFVLPARFCLPTANGLAAVLGIDQATDLESEALILLTAQFRLLNALRENAEDRDKIRSLAWTMARANWSWGPLVLAALGVKESAAGNDRALDVWRELPEWEEQAPPPPPEDHPISREMATERLKSLLQSNSEARPQQVEYTAEVAAAFAPRSQEGAPNLVLAEAGTGVGKTLGYIAPASAWAERNGGTVWISTYTKNLQRQVDQELNRLFIDEAEKHDHVVIRKGRENYLCLLNYQEAVPSAAVSQRHAVALSLMARWVSHSRDGDMVGGDFPAWLIDLLGRDVTHGLADQRGECIYSACDHYRRCFVENARRRSLHADIVVANHALVILRAAMGTDQDVRPPTRFVFDEGHHVFQAADSAFAAHLDGLEGAELRRWLLGTENRRRGGRAKGLENRIGDIVAAVDDGPEMLSALQHAARCLPSPGWLKRLSDQTSYGPYEGFLATVRAHVLARSTNGDSNFGIEADTNDPSEELSLAAAELVEAMDHLLKPMLRLIEVLNTRLDRDADELESGERQRIEAAVTSLGRRRDLVAAWRAMLVGLGFETPAEFVEWFALNRIAAREHDVGMYRHWVDPTIPFAQVLLRKAHGVLITSASLRDRPPDVPEDWTSAEVRTGANHMPIPAIRHSVDSPFDYKGRSRIIVVNDLTRDSADQISAAYRELFLAAGGGGLGLFTAIHRLRAVHSRIAEPLEEAGLSLMAQHVDAMDAGTLVDIFRAERDSCLLGTDALRDGVDVPGASLRLVVFDRVPWPRPDILHRARKKEFGRAAYDDMLTRLKLKQAYGRLMRKADDAGVFVILDSRLPTRLTTAFPQDVAIERIGLAEAVRETGEFLTQFFPRN
jgi:ATP-dependent DNA helicase DinG